MKSTGKAKAFFEDMTLIRSGWWLALISLLYFLSLIGALVMQSLLVPLGAMFVHLMIHFGMYDEPVEDPVLKGLNEIGLAMIGAWLGLILYLVIAVGLSNEREKGFSVAFGIGIALALIGIPLFIAVATVVVCSSVLSGKK